MGGHDHGHHHGPPYTIPDYRIYQVKDAPLLVTTQKALAAKGLKDPWLRNEVWRYDTTQWGTFNERVGIVFKRGFKYGFAAFVVTVVGTKIYDVTVGGGHGEHH